MAATDRILIKDLLVRGIIGLNDWERKKHQDILISMELFVDARAAAASEAIADALDYRTLTKAVMAYAESSGHHLVEALAHEIARIAVLDHGAERAVIRVEKPGAVRFARSAGIEVERTAADFA
ncbi:MAG: dihydroneopterin aldolase [Gemmatimonadota bacterium]